MPYERETERGDMQTERVREAATRDEIDFVSEILFSSMGLFQRGHKAYWAHQYEMFLFQ